MAKIKINSYWLKELPNAEFNSSVELWVDNFNGVTNSNLDYKLFLWQEPQEILPIRNELIRQSKNFNYIITCDEILLNSINNGILLEYGSSWINTEKYRNFNKEFSISTVCGLKKQLIGHKNRHLLWARQHEIKTPKKFYFSKGANTLQRGGNLELHDLKEPLFDSMFHICIENVSEKYHFTEKLIDALVCKTIPIYMGCTNISDYFNPKGMFSVNSIDEMINICNSLTTEDYYNRLTYIEENYEIALKFRDFRGNLTKKIKELVNE